MKRVAPFRSLKRRVESILTQSLQGAQTRVPVTRSSRSGADYQSHVALRWKWPQEKVTEWSEKINGAESTLTTTVTPPGFLNVRLADAFLAAEIEKVAKIKINTGNEEANSEDQNQEDEFVVVIDYCSPNYGKPLHVGHLRSSLIGDAISRLVQFRHADAKADCRAVRVIRQSHVGDWGRHVGMVMVGMMQMRQADSTLDESEMGTLYANVSQKMQHCQETRDQVRNVLSRLHSLLDGTGGLEGTPQGDGVTEKFSDEEIVQIWESVCSASRKHVDDILHKKLKISKELAIRSEASYAKRLPGLMQRLLKAGIAVEKDGALVALPEEQPPLLLKRNDGSYLYAATDVAAFEFRARDLKADWIIVVTDHSQKLHFTQLEKTVKQLAVFEGWAERVPKFSHASTGHVIDPSTNRPLSSRSGSGSGSEGVEGVLDLAIEAAGGEVDVGIGAVKYWDLVHDRSSDYVFDVERMLALKGDTSAYVQYACVRARSVLSRADSETDVDWINNHIEQVPFDEHERALAICVLSYCDAILSSASTLKPHHLCSHLRDTAVAFNSFYENCPVLSCEDRLRVSRRLALCQAVDKILSHGLQLLGLRAVEKM